MPAIADPLDILPSVQNAVDEIFESGEVADGAGEIFLRNGTAKGIERIYVTFENRFVTSFVKFAPMSPLDPPAAGDEKIAGFQVIYAVPLEFQRQGRAQRSIGAAIQRLKSELSRTNYEYLFLMAIVGDDNVPSQKLAAAVLCPNPTEYIEPDSGLPAKKYSQIFYLGQ